VIDDQSIDQGAEVDEVVPVAAIPSQARGLDAKDRTNGAGTDGRDQLLKAWALDQAGAGSA
jgi:hypothetical protein